MEEIVTLVRNQHSASSQDDEKNGRIRKKKVEKM